MAFSFKMFHSKVMVSFTLVVGVFFEGVLLTYPYFSIRLYACVSTPLQTLPCNNYCASETVGVIFHCSEYNRCSASSLLARYVHSLAQRAKSSE